MNTLQTVSLVFLAVCYSDFKTVDNDYNRPDVVKAGSASDNKENIPESFKQSNENNGKFSKEYEDNAINAQWEKEKKQEASNDANAQCKLRTSAILKCLWPLINYSTIPLAKKVGD